jgi:hypothetical protein
MEQNVLETMKMKTGQLEVDWTLMSGLKSSFQLSLTVELLLWMDLGQRGADLE